MGSRVDLTCMFGKEVVTFRFFASSKGMAEKVAEVLRAQLGVKTCALWACSTLPTIPNFSEDSNALLLFGGEVDYDAAQQRYGCKNRD